MYITLHYVALISLVPKLLDISCFSVYKPLFVTKKVHAGKASANMVASLRFPTGNMNSLGSFNRHELCQSPDQHQLLVNWS